MREAIWTKYGLAAQMTSSISRTAIFFGAHGSGTPMMLAYRHGLDRDYTHCHCNLARTANRTLLVWHNRQTEHTSPWEREPHASVVLRHRHKPQFADSWYVVLIAKVHSCAMPANVVCFACEAFGTRLTISSAIAPKCISVPWLQPRSGNLHHACGGKATGTEVQPVNHPYVDSWSAPASVSHFGQ